MTLGGAAQVTAAHCPNERTLDPAGITAFIKVDQLSTAFTQHA